MPSVVVDRSYILPAMCSSRSKYRALLALLDYGRIRTFLRWGHEEWEQIPPAAKVGGPSYDQLSAAGEDEKARLEDQLGHVTDDWCLVTSDLLQETYADAARRYAGAKFGVELSDDEINALARRVLMSATG